MEGHWFFFLAPTHRGHWSTSAAFQSGKVTANVLFAPFELLYSDGTLTWRINMKPKERLLSFLLLILKKTSLEKKKGFENEDNKFNKD